MYIMRNIVKQLVSKGATMLMLSIVACAKLPGTTPKQYEITRFRRKNIHSQPCVVGHIDQPFDEESWRVQYTIIAADAVTTYPDDTGNYYRVFRPGLHTIRFGYIGLLLVSVTNIQMHTGDSIRLDVHMQQDTAKLRAYRP